MRRMKWAAWRGVAGSFGSAAAVIAASGCGSSSPVPTAVDAGGNGGVDSGGGAGVDSGGGVGVDSGGSVGVDSGGSVGVDSGTSPSGTVGGVPGGQVGVGTVVNGCQIFPADNPWNVEVDGPNVQVTPTYDAHLVTTATLHPDFGGYTTDIGGIPYNTVDAGQPDLPIVFSQYASESDPGPGGWTGANPVTTGADTRRDGVSLLRGNEDRGQSRSRWNARESQRTTSTGSCFSRALADVLPTRLGTASSCRARHSSAPTAPCSTSRRTRCAPRVGPPAMRRGSPILAGLVRLSEVQAGAVTHAIRVTFNTTQNGYIPPATHAAGSDPLGSAYPPMGLRLRLKASVPTATYTAASQSHHRRR